MRSTTAISLGLAVALATPAAGATTATIERLHAAAAAYAPDAAALPSRAELDARCATDALCAAHRVAAAFAGDARLERVEHPDTDTIRWVTTRPSVRALAGAPDGAARVALDRFGRKADRELRAALAGAERVVLDLRANSGGDFERMLGIAGMFTGPVPAALYLVHGGARAPRAIPAAAAPLRPGELTVEVGPETASSGEMLAALLRRYAGARIVGARTFGKDYLERAVPVTHDWRLMVPAERVEIPGETLAGGIVPDRPLARP